MPPTTKRTTKRPSAKAVTSTKKTASAKRQTPLTSDADAPLTVPGLTTDEGHDAGTKLQMRLHALNDLALVLKHAHWNVVGPHFIGVHQMLDPQIDGVRRMIDEAAERMAMLGVAPNGLPGALVRDRHWDDYSLMRADATAHLAALDLVYTGVIEDHRKVMDDLEDIDLVSQDMLVGHVAELEKYQWFIRAHLQNASGTPSTQGADDETSAARLALDADA